ncbi:MAG: chemotaxis protein CheW [Deltaproteobacteria bacterium]|nr:chemotaxis protein CheW [Deltaproteobacteria bacterium]
MTVTAEDSDLSFSRQALKKGAKNLQFATFYLGQELFGINILQVQEILMDQIITPVPLAPPFVSGLISLRGQIVTAVDLKRRLGIDKESQYEYAYHIVVKGIHSISSLQVDRIGEVIAVKGTDLDPPPDSLKGIEIKYLEGVYPLEHEILAVLNIDNILEAN